MRPASAESKWAKTSTTSKKRKQPVVGLRQPKGPLRFIYTKDAKAEQPVAEHVEPDVEL